MDVVISYDVSDKNPQVKAAMGKKGYYDGFGWKDGAVWMPNSTLWKKEGTPRQAIDDLSSVATALNVKVERAIATTVGETWCAEWGEPHSD